MKHLPRGIVLLIILIVIVLLAISPSLLATTNVGKVPAEADISIAQQPERSTPAPPATQAETPTQAVVISSAVLDAPENPSPTPLAIEALDLQTIVPRNTLEPNSTAVEGWNLPPLEVPLAYHPFDHYWLVRPVGSNNENSELSYYPYGSDGPRNNLRIHHGIDIANPIGVEICAAGSGSVVWADKGHFNEYESITAYGNTVVIEHDFGDSGQRIYTLYAHLSAILVSKGERIQSGQVIGLIGDTGQVTGPHVHFEVRVGLNSYYTTRNPVLWIAPYLGTGVVAGRITFPDGSVVADALLMLVDRETGQVVERTNSYAGFGVTGDDSWNENFVFADVPAGRYIVSSNLSTIMWSGEVDVVPGVTNWVELERYTREDIEEGVEEKAEELAQ